MGTIKIIIVVLLLVCQMFSAFADDRIKVKVGGYLFPPFVEISKNNYTGITLDMIKAVNAFQGKYQFEFVLTAPKRRYLGFEANSFDMMFFESIQWGWQGREVVSSNSFLTGGEVYITKAVPGKDQSYFDDFTGKSIAGILGYHYQFANFNSDRKVLENQYNMTLFTRHEAVFLPVVKGRIDIAITTLSFLKNYLKTHPVIKDQIMVSKKFDQIYHHTILIRQGFEPGVSEMNKLLKAMADKGALNKIWTQYGLDLEIDSKIKKLNKGQMKT